MNKYDPNSVSPPWHTLQEIKDEYGGLGISLMKMAEVTNISINDLRDALSGTIPIKGEIAEKLEKAYFGTAEFWEARTKRYETWLEGKNDISI